VVGDINAQSVAVGDNDNIPYIASTHIPVVYQTISNPFNPQGLATPSGINDQGTVVGTYGSLPDQVLHGFIWSGGVLTSFDMPGSSGTAAFAINNLGQIVGDYKTADGHFHGFLYSGGSFTTIDAPGATDTAITDINDSGQMVGTYTDSQHISHYFLANAGHPLTCFHDFNGDGQSDILWQNVNGQVVTWDMSNGQSVVGSGNFGTVASTWHIAGVGDFNGDGRSDIVWQNVNGQIGTWDLNDNKIVGGTTVTTIAATWHLAGIGDFDGDGRSDMLWQNANGQVVSWDMNDGQIVASGNFGTIAPTWHVAGTATSMVTARPTSCGATTAVRS